MSTHGQKTPIETPWLRRAWFFVSSPLLGPGTIAAVLREIENLDDFGHLVEGHSSAQIVKAIKLHLRHRARRIFGLE